MDVTRALKLLPEPDPRGERRILRRFARTRAERRHRLFHGLAVATLALAAALVAWVSWPPPPRVVRVDAAPGTAERLLWSDAVDLTVAGTGEVTGTSHDVVVHWQSGELRVRVDPGARLAVRADEGQTRVTGTAFRVVRDGLGLTAVVDEGAVQVSCADGTERELDATAGPWTCWPVSPARLLGRADTLRDRDAPLSEVRATLDRAIAALGPHDRLAVHGELLVRRMRVLAELDEPAAALAAARTYVSGFTLRSGEVRRFAAELAIEAHADCAEALPHLEAIDGDPDFRWLRETCRRRLGRSRPGALVDQQAENAGPTSERVRRWAWRLGERE